VSVGGGDQTIARAAGCGADRGGAGCGGAADASCDAVEEANLLMIHGVWAERRDRVAHNVHGLHVVAGEDDVSVGVRAAAAGSAELGLGEGAAVAVGVGVGGASGDGGAGDGGDDAALGVDLAQQVLGVLDDVDVACAVGDDAASEVRAELGVGTWAAVSVGVVCLEGAPGVAGCSGRGQDLAADPGAAGARAAGQQGCGSGQGLRRLCGGIPCREQGRGQQQARQDVPGKGVPDRFDPGF
jgi:hypothetical protein